MVLNENETYVIEAKLRSGCYEVGFYSKERLFYSPMYQLYSFKHSRFELKLLNNADKELKKIDIDNNSKLQHGFNPSRFSSDISYVALDLFKVSLQDNHTIKAVINVKKLNILFKNREVYLYFNKYASSCDMKKLSMIDKKFAYPINRKETNASLIPL